jgi:GT2 family glycosyltransferase
VAVVIPTKGNVEMLFDCVRSFFEHCNHNLFTIFIADTGSNGNEKDWIRQNILTMGNVELIEYDYYNFAKINNDVVRNHISEDYSFILFCNNDIKLMNNVIYNMLTIFKENVNVGTVGARLHFDDNTIQHSGIMINTDENGGLRLGHIGYQSYYNFINNNTTILGNTGALLMIRKNIFVKCGMFNENYVEYFEDVELNLTSILLGYKNYISGKSVAIHYESKSRNEVPGIYERQQLDGKRLSEFFNKHRHKLFTNGR